MRIEIYFTQLDSRECREATSCVLSYECEELLAYQINIINHRWQVKE